MKRINRIIHTFFFIILINYTARSQTAIVSFNSSWKYLDNGSNQNTKWRAVSFNDGTWKTGNGKFGYGISDATTIIKYGTYANKKYITTYFRKTFFIDVSAYSSFTANVKRDDGVVVYVNGSEVYRNNMPKGTISYSTLATDATDNGTIAQNFTIKSTLLKSGNNLIAVEIHQQSANTSDMAFDMELIGNPLPKDTTPPSIVSINRSNPTTALTNATTVIFRASFSEKVTNVDETDFTLFSNNITAIINNLVMIGTTGSVYDITINNIVGEGNLRLDLNNSGTNITDSANNLITSGFSNGQSYTFDFTPPIVNNIILQDPATASTTSLAVTYRVSFSEDVKDVETSDFSTTNLSGNVAASISSIKVVNASLYDVLVNIMSGTGELRLDVKANGITDIVGNAIVNDYTSGPAYTIEKSPEAPPTDSIITFKSNWKYLDNGSDQGTSWRGIDFNDDGWKSGYGKFGYGINDAATIINYGNNANNKYITTYFRKNLFIKEPANFDYYAVKINRDDGIIVYVNGNEVYRNNMPVGTISYTTLAAAATGSDDGTIAIPFNIPGNSMISGNNVVAVEIHQYAVNSSDIAFDMQMIGGVGTPPAEPAQILYYEGFESGTGFAGQQIQTSTTYGFRIETSPTYNGLKVGRWELRAGDPPVANGTRAEVLFTSALALEETWHSYAGYFPNADYMEEAHSEIFNQWHQGISGLPMLTFSTMHDRFYFKKRGFDTLPTITYDLGNIPKDQWVEIVIHLKQHLTNGFVKIWINGELKLNIDGGATMFEGPYGRWKMGIYKSLWNDGGTTNVDKRVWYVDEVKIGNASATYEFMKPFGDNITYLPLQKRNDIMVLQQDRQAANTTFNIFPTKAMKGLPITIQSNNSNLWQCNLTDINGRLVKTLNFSGTGYIQTTNLNKGIYFISIYNKKVLQKQKIIVTE